MRLPADRARAVMAAVALASAAAPACANDPPTPRTSPPAGADTELHGHRQFDAGAAVALNPAVHAVGDDDVLALHRDAANRMTVAVSIGTLAGRSGAFAFLVDTGAERTVIARTVANALGLVPSGRSMVVGMAGQREVDMVTVEQIMLGRRHLYAVASPVLDADAIGADGIIGLDGLQGQRVLLDFDANRMILGDWASLGGERGYDVVVRARRKSGQLILTDATVDGVHTDIVIDTGSDMSIGNLALARALAQGHRAEAVQLISVTGQKATADLGMARHLDLAGMTLNNTLIAYSDAPPFARLGLRRRPALLLGMTQLRLFHRVVIDFAGHRILFAVPGAAAG